MASFNLLSSRSSGFVFQNFLFTSRLNLCGYKNTFVYLSFLLLQRFISHRFVLLLQDSVLRLNFLTFHILFLFFRVRKCC